jgi:two-component system response regulator AdeR
MGFSFARSALPDTRAVLDLTLTEFRILSPMIRAPRRAFSRAELLDACLGESDAVDRTIDNHSSHLRKKMAGAGADGYFAGVRGVGYRMVPL